MRRYGADAVGVGAGPTLSIVHGEFPGPTAQSDVIYSVRVPYFSIGCADVVCEVT